MAQIRWRISQSIALEVERAIAAAMPGRSILSIDSYFRERTPPEWLREWRGMLGHPPRHVSVVSMAATLADVIFEEDYARATLAIRSLDLDTAFARLEEAAARYGIDPDTSPAPAYRLGNLTAEIFRRQIESVGIRLNQVEAIARSVREDGRRVLAILKGGAHHDRFWHWLDRFYYEIYKPWRADRLDRMASRLSQLTEVLGQKHGLPAGFEWLPAHHPLRVNQEIKNAVEQGKIGACFWIEPFDLPDSIAISTDWFIFSVGRSVDAAGMLRAEAEPVAERLKALADPTRLAILRLIRYFGMDNTEMARYFGISRPTVSNHAKVLREAGLIRSSMDGRGARHELIPEALRTLMNDLISFLDIDRSQDNDEESERDL